MTRARALIPQEAPASGPAAAAGPSPAQRDVPPWLDALIARCLAPEAAGRFGSAGEISEELHRLKGSAQG